MIQKVFNKISNLTSQKIVHKKYLTLLKRSNEDTKKRAIIFQTPEHGNLGDQAILKAEEEFLENYFPELTVIKIPSEMVANNLTKLKQLITEQDLLFIHGGGFLGTLWQNEEDTCRIIIKNFLNNKVIFFPQTIFYEDSDFGKQSLKESKEVYNNRPNLILTAREEKSMEFFQKNYPNTKSILVPDIVLTLNKIDNTIERNGILVCLRSDKESIFNKEIINTLVEVCKEKEIPMNLTDTIVPKFISDSNRDFELSSKWKEFQSAKIVITDRLHGMIFSYITNTPCIALNNKSGKVKGVYKWISQSNQITFLDNFNYNLLVQEIERLQSLKKADLNNNNITLDQYSPLLNEIKLFYDN